MKIKDRDVSQGIISGAVSLTVATLIVKILGVLYKIPLANILGDEGMGYFNSAYTVYSFFYLLCTAGVPKSVMILISEKLGGDKEGSVNRIVNIAVKSFFVIGFSVSFLFSAFAIPLSRLIGSDESYVTMIFVAPSIIFSSVAGVLRGYLSAKMKLFGVAVSSVIEGAVKLIFGLLLSMLAFRLGLTLPMISAFAILGATVGSLFGLLHLIHVIKSEKTDVNSKQNGLYINKKDVLAKIFKISFPITLSAALMSLSGMVDLFLVIRRLEAIGYTAKEATALYGNYSTLAISMFNLALSIITPISVAFMPSLTKSRALGDFRSFDSGVESALSLTAFVGAPIVFGLSVYGKEILSFLFGESVAEVGAPLLTLICPGIFFMSVLLIFNSSLEALGRAGLATFSMLFGVGVKIIVSGILLGNPDFGISGAPIGTVISYAVSAFLSLLFLSHILEYNVPVFSRMFLSYLLASISVLGSRMIYEPINLGFGSVAALMSAIFSSALIYIALSVFFGGMNRQKISKMAKFTNLS